MNSVCFVRGCGVALRCLLQIKDSRLQPIIIVEHEQLFSQDVLCFEIIHIYEWLCGQKWPKTTGTVPTTSGPFTFFLLCNLCTLRMDRRTDTICNYLQRTDRIFSSLQCCSNLLVQVSACSGSIEIDLNTFMQLLIFSILVIHPGWNFSASCNPTGQSILFW